MPSATRGSHKYGKKTQLAQILCSSSSDSPVPVTILFLWTVFTGPEAIPVVNEELVRKK